MESSEFVIDTCGQNENEGNEENVAVAGKSNSSNTEGTFVVKVCFK